MVWPALRLRVALKAVPPLPPLFRRDRGGPRSGASVPSSRFRRSLQPRPDPHCNPRSHPHRCAAVFVRRSQMTVGLALGQESFQVWETQHESECLAIAPAEIATERLMPVSRRLEWTHEPGARFRRAVPTKGAGVLSTTIKPKIRHVARDSPFAIRSQSLETSANASETRRKKRSPAT